MKLVIGLGNPGSQYAHTPHNVGFVCVERIADLQGWRFNQKRAESQVAEGEINYVRVVLAKPQTFMNNSGLAGARLMQSFRVNPADMLVIYDDIDLVAGTIRMRERGSAGTHNGMRSIIRECRTSDFPRLRIGIAGQEPYRNLRDYVLQVPTGEEAEFMKQGVERAAEAAIAWVKEGAAATMNRFNG
ncbi:MAG: aminoacyl-tRNA hydrolase [Chloroflexota bacterium]